MTATQLRTLDEQIAYENSFIDSFSDSQDIDPIDELDYMDGYDYHNDYDAYDAYDVEEPESYDDLYDDGDYSME